MMTSTLQQRQMATPDQAMRAFAGLSPTEQHALQQIARLRALGLRAMAWEDLLQEALYRTFAGKRLWPLDVNFVAFLAQTMRSIASEERKKMALEPVEFESDLRNEDDTLDLSGLAVDTRTPESEAMARAALKQIDQMFSSDQEALHILRGLAEGLTPAETQAMAGMTGTQYANTQKRIQRALSRKFGKDINA